jgi:hypothetical protein
VSIRGALSAAATCIVAIVVALAVPVSQLRTVSTVVTCCCPDPTHCHCPDHKPDHNKKPSMSACHKTQHVTAAAQAPAFVTEMIEIASNARPVVRTTFPEPPMPRPDTWADEVYGPS